MLCTLYVAPNVDKSLQYIDPAGFSRSHGQEGIIIQGDFYVDAKADQLISDRFKTEEMAIPTEMLGSLHIRRAYNVKRFAQTQKPHSGKFNVQVIK